MPFFAFRLSSALTVLRYNGKGLSSRGGQVAPERPVVSIVQRQTQVNFLNLMSETHHGKLATV